MGKRLTSTVAILVISTIFTCSHHRSDDPGSDVVTTSTSSIKSGLTDTTFGANGIVIQNESSDGISMAVDSKNRILVLTDPGVTVRRYNADGTIDTTFNGTASVTFGNATGGPYIDNATSLAITGANTVLATGSSADSSGRINMVIWKINEDGTPDTTFNGTGFVVFHHPAGTNRGSQGNSITTDANGRILVAGWILVPGNINNIASGQRRMAVWRYNDDGTVDTTFNGTGFIEYELFDGSSCEASALVVDGFGRVLITGKNNNSSEGAVWRYNADGTPDASFHGVGFVTLSDPNGQAYGSAITIDTDGKILVGGNFGATSMVIWRLNADGALDEDFNTTGYVTYDSGLYGDSRAIKVDLQGRVLLAGTGIYGFGTGELPLHHAVLLRFNPDGTPDTTFNNSGVVLGTAGTDLNTMSIDADGKIIVCGNASGHLAIWRYLP